MQIAACWEQILTTIVAGRFILWRLDFPNGFTLRKIPQKACMIGRRENGVIIMKYKLDQSISKIVAPIILVVGDEETVYESGKALADADFDKKYLIDFINVRNGNIVITLKENDMINDTNWCGEEQTSFF